MKKQQKLTRERLLTWLRDDPYREAQLVDEVPVKPTTLARIKSGTYVPSQRLANAMLAVMGRAP